MGAKFAPCMRSDKRLQQVLAEDKKYENETGCCVKSDKSGCIQTTEKECSVSRVHFLPIQEDEAKNKLSQQAL